MEVFANPPLRVVLLTVAGVLSLLPLYPVEVSAGFMGGSELQVG